MLGLTYFSMLLKISSLVLYPCMLVFYFWDVYFLPYWKELELIYSKFSIMVHVILLYWFFLLKQIYCSGIAGKAYKIFECDLILSINIWRVIYVTYQISWGEKHQWYNFHKRKGVICNILGYIWISFLCA